MESNPSEKSRTLWIGDLDSWMDESFLHSLLTSLGYSKQLAAIKLIKDKTSGLPLKYGFLQFLSHKAASNFYINHNNRTIPNTNKQFKLNWAAYGGNNRPAVPSQAKTGQSQIQIYIGDIDPLATQYKLLEHFRSKYPSAFSAKIITDTATKLSKGYGFVKFTSQDEANKAIAATNGHLFMSKMLKVSTAFMKSKEEVQEDNNEEIEGQLLLKQKLYTQFYSLINDPQMKAEYQKQVLKAFGNEQTKKDTLKQSLGEIRGLSFNQTKESQRLLEAIPRIIQQNHRYATLYKICQK